MDGVANAMYIARIDVFAVLQRNIESRPVRSIRPIIMGYLHLLRYLFLLDVKRTDRTKAKSVMTGIYDSHHAGSLFAL